MKKSLSLVLGAVGAVAILSSCKPSAPADQATPTPAPQASPTAEPSASPEAGLTIKDPVATVNGEPIAKAELDEAFNNAVQASGVKVEDLNDAQKLEGYNQLLDELILDKLITKAAANVEITQAEVDAEIAKIKSQFPSEEEFNKQLAAAGQTPEKINVSLKKMLQQQKWLESQIADKIAVSDADAKSFYDSNQAEFQEPATVKASHILFRVNKEDSPEVSEQKLAAAKKAIARAKKEDFTKLAKELSEEPGAAESGGDLGFFSKDRMVPEFADAAFSQKKNAVSTQPVKTQFGYHVIKVTDTKAARTVPYDEAKEQITNYLKTDKQRQAVQELIKGLRDGAKVESTLPAPPAPEAPAPAVGLPGADAATPTVETGAPSATPSSN